MAAASSAHSPFTPRLGELVGRTAELRFLEKALRAAVSGHGRLVLVAGEPGIGKTRLCEELAAQAARSGATVLYGRCYVGGSAPPFSPWVRALEGVARSMEDADLRAALGDAAFEVAQLAPAIRQRLSEMVPPADPDAPGERSRLFHGVARFLARLAHPRGVVVVLDDLHDADPSSLMLLELVARKLASMAVLIVGTYRDTATASEHAWMTTLAAIAALPGNERLTLGGLSAAEVRRLVEQRAGARPPISLAATLQDKTEGNPLFVGEYLRALAAEGRLTPEGFAKGWFRKVPARVQTVIAWRLATLSDPCRSILRTAAVIGREFHLEELKRAVRMTAGASIDVAEPLHEALLAGTVLADSEIADGYRFAHALIRDVLYEELPAGERANVHRRVGAVIEQSGGAHERLAELAYHFCAAEREADLERGAHYARLAGQCAMSLLAYEEAVRLYQLGWTALGRSASPSPRGECELLLALGDAQARADDVAGAKASLLRAAEIARRHGLRELLSTAALGYGTDLVEGDQPAPDPTQTALLEEALLLWDGEDGALHVRLLARLALALVFSASQARSAALAVRAVEMAERIGDPQALAHALRARRIVARQPADTTGRLADTDRIVQIARAAGNRRLELQAHCWRLHDLLELADAAAAAHEIDDCVRLAEKIRQPACRFQAALLRIGEPLRAGRWAEAQSLLDDACAITPEHARSYYASALCHANASLFRGGTEATADLFVAMLERYPSTAVRAGCAYYLARLGRNAEARRHVEMLAADDFASVPRNVWIVATCHVAAACVTLGDAKRAATLYELLSPCSSLAAIMVTIEAYCGPVAHYLAILAAALERWEAAERHFEQALETSRRLAARPWLAETKCEYARMLSTRHGVGDVARGDRLLEEALATARELDMPELLLRAPSLLGKPSILGGEGRRDAVAAQRRAMEPSSTGSLVFAELGDHWAVSYAGVEVHLKNSKGVRYLAELVRHPRRAFEASDLAAAVEDAAEEGDTPSAAVARWERVRSAVTKRLRAEIRKIDALHPALGRHLAATVSTGHVCCYAPEGKRARRRSATVGNDA